MVRMEGAWLEPDWPARRAAASPVTSSERHSHSVDGDGGIEWLATTTAAAHVALCARRVSAWPGGHGLVSLHDWHPGYWIHWIPMARHDDNLDIEARTVGVRVREAVEGGAGKRD
jgi:hypothetical protein